MVRKYPVKQATSAPATGRIFYEFLMRNIKIPAAANHTIWYLGAEAQLAKPTEYAFRGDIPVGNTLDLIALGGKPVTSPYILNGKEDCVLVSDLSEGAKVDLGIPVNARGKDKVYNSNFKPYDQLPELTKISNELAALSLPKSISSYLAGVKGKVNYSEKEVLNFLNTAVSDLSSPEMMHILHGNNQVWNALAYIRGKGNVEGDLMAEFHAQNPDDFYQKDLGTILPATYFALASLGQDPAEAHKKIDVYVWGAKEAADYMRKYMPQN